MRASAGMLFVRNPTGISHSPAERATLADSLTGVDAPGAGGSVVDEDLGMTTRG